MLPSLLSFATEFASILLDATTFVFGQLSVFLKAEINNLRRMIKVSTGIAFKSDCTFREG
jgi:hypothetical protein